MLSCLSALLVGLHPRSNSTDTLFPYPTLFRSAGYGLDLLLGLQEGPQRDVDLVGVGPQQAVWGALDLHVLRLRERLVEAPGGRIDGEDVVAAAVQEHSRLAALPVAVDLGPAGLHPILALGKGGDAGSG